MQVLRRPLAALFAGAALLTLAACAGPKAGEEVSSGVYDPLEKMNRATHQFNRGMDRILFRPASKGYVVVIPQSVRTSVSYFAENLGKPAETVDYILQGKLKEAGVTVLRFVTNLTMGIGGLGDPATELGIPNYDTDFGEVLYTWGVGEGPYVELPFFGPSTARDSAGLVVDFFTNPIAYATGDQTFRYVRYGSYILDQLNSRGTYSELIDSILYGSADSYSQARIIYLQTRRYELAGDDGSTYLESDADANADSYEDFYANAYDAPPYGDPPL
ncbi:MlaA family lipoprotein [Chachezhania sediminis]|uniref:MlaA family lipoprotein n=1 Tax=Chachezhania sediminis TaxID=2599291 RepID=UPI0018EF2585|nr:VacJ family lipoprotein [Chachezhania sediminis]